MAATLLAVEDLHSEYVGPVGLELAAGSCIGLSGPSGGGKSAFCRALVDLDPNTGRCRCGEVDRASVPAHQWRRLVAYLPAESAWWAERCRDHFPDPAADDLDGRFDELGLAASFLDADPHRCSSGERQRMALLRALLYEPRVLLLDEITANLDPDSTTAVVALLQRFRDEGGALLWISHDAALRERVVDRELVMADGGLRDT